MVRDSDKLLFDFHHKSNEHTQHTYTYLLPINSQHATRRRLTSMSTGTISALTLLGP